MRVDVHWRKLRDTTKDDGWDRQCVLYAYYSPLQEIAYISKADWYSVAERSTESAKRDFWERYVRETSYQECIAALGELELSEGRRFSSLLLSDIEGLLIHQVKPLFNKQCITSRISRRGLVICCQGYWPLPRNWFHDVE